MPIPVAIPQSAGAVFADQVAIQWLYANDSTFAADRAGDTDIEMALRVDDSAANNVADETGGIVAGDFSVLQVIYSINGVAARGTDTTDVARADMPAGLVTAAGGEMTWCGVLLYNDGTTARLCGVRTAGSGAANNDGFDVEMQLSGTKVRWTQESGTGLDHFVQFNGPSGITSTSMMFFVIQRASDGATVRAWGAKPGDATLSELSIDSVSNMTNNGDNTATATVPVSLGANAELVTMGGSAAASGHGPQLVYSAALGASGAETLYQQFLAACAAQAAA